MSVFEPVLENANRALERGALDLTPVEALSAAAREKWGVTDAFVAEHGDD